MSRLSELIAELCPDGVEYKALCEIGSSQKGVRVVRKQLSDDGLYPVYQNSLTPLGYHESTNRNAGMPFVIGAGAASQIGYCDVDWWAADDCFTFDIPGDVALGRYVYYCLLNQQDYLRRRVRKASIPRLARSVVEKLRIPVPPIEIQREIVRVLDKYTAVHDKLVNELKRELEMHAQQKEALLEQAFDLVDVEYRKLITVADVLYGAAFKSSLFNVEGNGLPIIRIRDVLRGYSETYYSGAYEEKYVINDGDMLLGMDGNFNLQTWSGGKALLNQRVCRITTKNDVVMLNGFLKYWLKPVFKSYEDDISRTTVAHMSAKIINGICIPVPPIEVQREIVRMLDEYTAAHDELIEQLRKQCAYYEAELNSVRNHLLSFPEKVG